MRKLIFLIVFLTLLAGFDVNRYKFFKLNDTPVTYKQVLYGHDKTILFLWTTWCHFCRDELKRLSESCPAFLKQEKLYYVNVGEKKEAVERLMEVLRIDDCIKDETILDQQAILARKFHIVGVPTFLFLKKGKLVYKSWYLNKALIERVFGDE